MPLTFNEIFASPFPSIEEIQDAERKKKEKKERKEGKMKISETQKLTMEDNDFISSILDQVTAGLKNSIPAVSKTQEVKEIQTETPQKKQIVSVAELPAKLTPTKPTQNARARFSPYGENVQNKKQKKNKKRNNKKKQAPTHLDTPAEKKEADFDSEMERYFAVSSANNEIKATPIAEVNLKRKMEEDFSVDVQVCKKRNIWQNNKQKKQKFVPLVTCKYFSQGYCKDGDACTFKHDSSNDPAVCPLWVKGKCGNGDLCRLNHQGPRSITICQYFKSNSCAKGDHCPFSHELSAEPCRFFHMKKVCEQGDSCPYSHEPLTAETLRWLRQLTGPCRFWQFKGYCVTGDNCLFSHEVVSEEERKKLESTITPCTYYHVRGNCRSGDECFYLHDEASPEQIKQLKKAEEEKKAGPLGRK